MANEQNLKPIRKGELTKEEAKRRGSNGGKKSAKTRRENKLIKDRILERMGETDWDDMIDGLIKRAKEGDKAFEILRDTIGQKPSDVIEVTGIAEQQSKVDELLDQLHEGRK
jgi:hypothetical protein